MKYRVKVIETLSRVVEVEADSKDEAFEKVQNMWCASEIELTNDDLDEHEIYVQ